MLQNEIIEKAQQYITPQNIAIAGGITILLILLGIDPLTLFLLCTAGCLAYKYYTMLQAEQSEA